ncbi:lysophospholipid acyltransferase family protein [Parvularcula sp. LCG005]|uniref:lysophospholipid acyltransferase family protein n=1 Tax=Parvularcula sp. LCG005 TaxID=3078805 RepID=UPI002942C4E5|nr:lysophospholipid acyltransferase family protein [Parvularcula sp. LCG005]WOI53670.1 lysophospholipid acyltransferase family protein [Parvularcula sp. LCG005]
MPRSILFRAAYYLVSTFFVVTAMPLLLWPTRRPVARWIQAYCQVMVWLMRHIGGIDVRLRGLDHLPDGPFIIASKHQSWGDGFVVFAAIPDLAFVTGGHLLNYPLLGPILRKLGAIVVNNCGGVAARGRLMAEEMEKASAEGRSILIYPEGHLSPVGTQHRYRKGVFHLYEKMNCPVVPVATDLGLRWPQQSAWIVPGPCSVEFLPAIAPGLDKECFMAELEQMIETRSLSLLHDQAAAGTLPAAIVPSIPTPA